MPEKVGSSVSLTKDVCKDSFLQAAGESVDGTSGSVSSSDSLKLWLHGGFSGPFATQTNDSDSFRSGEESYSAAGSSESLDPKLSDRFLRLLDTKGSDLDSCYSYDETEVVGVTEDGSQKSAAVLGHVRDAQLLDTERSDKGGLRSCDKTGVVGVEDGPQKSTVLGHVRDEQRLRRLFLKAHVNRLSEKLCLELNSGDMRDKLAGLETDLYSDGELNAGSVYSAVKSLRDAGIANLVNPLMGVEWVRGMLPFFGHGHSEEEIQVKKELLNLGREFLGRYRSSESECPSKYSLEAKQAAYLRFYPERLKKDVGLLLFLSNLKKVHGKALSVHYSEAENNFLLSRKNEELAAIEASKAMLEQILSDSRKSFKFKLLTFLEAVLPIRRRIGAAVERCKLIIVEMKTRAYVLKNMDENLAEWKDYLEGIDLFDGNQDRFLQVQPVVDDCIDEFCEAVKWQNDSSCLEKLYELRFVKDMHEFRKLNDAARVKVNDAVVDAAERILDSFEETKRELSCEEFGVLLGEKAVFFERANEAMRSLVDNLRSRLGRESVNAAFPSLLSELIRVFRLSSKGAGNYAGERSIAAVRSALISSDSGFLLRKLGDMVREIKELRSAGDDDINEIRVLLRVALKGYKCCAQLSDVIETCDELEVSSSDLDPAYSEVANSGEQLLDVISILKPQLGLVLNNQELLENMEWCKHEDDELARSEEDAMQSKSSKGGTEASRAAHGFLMEQAHKIEAK